MIKFLKKIKTKQNKKDLIKLKSFYISKETINRTKRQLSEWETIFANEVINKGLIFKIHKQHDSNKPNNPMKKWEKDLNRLFFFSQTYKWLTNTTSLIFREMQVKGTVR